MADPQPAERIASARRALWLALACTLLAAAVAFTALSGALAWTVCAAVALAAAGLALAMRRTDAACGELLRSAQASSAQAAQAQSMLQRLREALDALPSGLEIYDHEDRLLLYNKRLLELYPWIRFDEQLGRTFESILRRSIAEGRIEPAKGREEEWIAQRLVTRGTRPGPLLQNLKSGEWINTYERRTPSNLVVGVRLEVTDLVQKTRELEDSQARLQAIINSAAAAILSMDPQGEIAEFNDATLQLFGYAPDELVGQPLSLLVPAFDLVAASAPGTPAPAVRPMRDVEVLGRRRNGQTLQLNLSISDIHTAMGHQCVAIMTDLTQRTLAEQARLTAQRLEAENRQIQEANRLKGQFLANMSHELRTPLNAIIGFADLMHTGIVKPSSPKFHDFVGHIAGSGRHLLQLINDVLDLSKVESGKFVFHPEAVDIAALIGDVVQGLQTAVEQKQLRVHTVVDPGLGDRVLDPARLKQVLYNYLSNAIKFSHDHGHVSVRALEQGETHWRLEVEDTGVGIDAADLPRLFQEYQQLEDGYNKSHQGTGLGLALTRRLVQAQGGHVGASSTAGRGSLFYAVLNRVHGTDPVRADGDGATLPVAHRVLVIEHDPKVQTRLMDSLTLAGFQADGVSTAAQALRRVGGAGYDALALGMWLPDQGGLPLLAQIRASALQRNSPVLGLTMAGDAGAAASFAIADILCKPIRSDEVAAATAALRRRHASAAKVLVIDDDPVALDLMRATLSALGMQAVGLQDPRQSVAAVALHRPHAIVLDLVMPGFDGFNVLDALHAAPQGRDIPVYLWTSLILTDEEYDSLARTAREILSQGGGDPSDMLQRLRQWHPAVAEMALPS